ncbi:hypothetical protein [Nocardia sp. NPDC050710]|uniref:hypothetical protein n=1 Tax=Nocardia sp. NPDC050710 TaxID=3157220 RepID=UPI0033EBE6AF
MQRYLAAVTHHMTMGRLRIAQSPIGPLPCLTGVGSIVAASEFPIELAVCVATLDEVSPAAVRDFRRQVNEFARSLRGRSEFAERVGAGAVAALVSERVDPAALRAMKNKLMSYGSLVVPAVVDLGNRQLHIASNAPVIGRVVWNEIRSQARDYLPEPRLVLG